uniref:Retrotransposon Copia-like N-terminal domain-containing protein n=1 Tax=Opuntia streptacantha TaxID=393608 RepID=A0A7C9DJJ1_OPUST
MRSYAMAVAGGNRVHIEAADPLFLHPSDQPGLSLVADLFNGEDFENWRRSVTVALSAKQKLSLVDGSYKKPDASSPLLPYWQRCNDMVISWLLNSLHKNVRESVLFHNTASDIWDELNDRYGQSNKARLFQAQKAVSCMTQEDQDIANFFNKARKAWDEFAAVGATPRCSCSKCECQINARLQNYDQEQRIIQFLMGLNESYTAVRGNILMMTPFPNLSQVYSLLIQEEKQRQVKSKYDFQSDGASFSTTSGNAQKINTSRRFEGRRASLFCDHCRRTGHTIDKCYKLHGYPSNKQGGRGRGFRGANSALGEQEVQMESSSVPGSSNTLLPGLNQEQSKQLLQFLTNLTGGGDPKQLSPETTGSVHMAVFTDRNREGRKDI